MTDAPENNSLGGRARRYAKVGRAVGGLAARVAGERYLGLSLDKSKHAEDLKQALGGLKGPLMKVAQIMSTVPDMLPEEYVTELAELQSNAPAMGWLFVRRRMTTELGAGWQDRFGSFEKEAAAAASLGQVHRAVGPDGRALACKLQYPDMRSAVEADLKQLKIVFSIYSRYDKAVDFSHIHQEVSDRLREELDYELERRHIDLYRLMLQDETGVQVPDPLPALSTDRLLTMSWLDGKRLLDWVDTDLETRNLVAENMFRAWYVPFYYYGTIHGDPHLGNYSVRDDGSINLMDFGCIRIFHPRFVKGVIDLYHSLETGDRDLAVHAYETWGFADLSNEVLDTLNIWAEFVYGPLLEDRRRKIQETDGTMYGAKVANKVHAELRRLGGVTPPREFVLMDRAAIGLGSVFLHLKAEINWHRLFQDLIGDFDVDKLEKRQAAALKKTGIVRPD
ncbi:MAG: AarF/ABC1/UbiB kinase family protein [Rhodospirillaceae bacterium TMED63]|nr:ABC transporter ATP-binding protein [Rhodospirillaceae bacterium]RPG01753.1 MAG: AarF/ABC1/UbiB kinase family protein [Rhodospirillaceae bacterium TMED63]